MSKKSQTTGLPNRRKRSSGEAEVAETSQKGYRTRAEQEERIQRMIIWASGIIIAILVVVVIASFSFEQIVVPGRVVATVNGQNVTVSDFQKRVRLERSQLITQVVIVNIARLGHAPIEIEGPMTSSTVVTLLEFPSDRDSAGAVIRGIRPDHAFFQCGNGCYDFEN